jgi:hypothetical protein
MYRFFQFKGKPFLRFAGPFIDDDARIPSADSVDRRQRDALLRTSKIAACIPIRRSSKCRYRCTNGGRTKPILIAGHGRVLAARQRGLTEAPVIVARGWTNAPKRAYVLADNKLAFRMGVATIALIHTVAHFGAKEAAALASIADGSFDRAWVAPKRDRMMNP